MYGFYGIILAYILYMFHHHHHHSQAISFVEHVFHADLYVIQFSVCIAPKFQGWLWFLHDFILNIYCKIKKKL